LKTIATKTNFKNAVKAIRDHQQARPLQEAFTEQNKDTSCHSFHGMSPADYTTETKRAMVRGASNGESSAVMGKIASAAAAMYNPLKEKHCANPHADKHKTFGLKLKDNCVTGMELFSTTVIEANKAFRSCKKSRAACKTAVAGPRPAGCSCESKCHKEHSSMTWCPVSNNILFPCTMNNKNLGAKEVDTDSGKKFGSFDLCAATNDPNYDFVSECLLNDASTQLAYSKTPADSVKKCKKHTVKGANLASKPGVECCYRVPWGGCANCAGEAQTASITECPWTSAKCE